MKKDGYASGGANRRLSPDSPEHREKGRRQKVEDKQNRERQEARRVELRKTLCERLDKLRRNLELYPRQVLKTV